MRWTLPGTAIVALTAAATIGPLATGLAGVLGLAGSLTHELVHYAVAVAAGETNVALGWDAIGPYVAYGDPGDPLNPVVQLAPPAVALAGLAALTLTTSFPDVTPTSLYAASFLTGLHSLSPTDYQPLLQGDTGV